MANKYMTLDEAAKFLSMSTDKLMRLREQGEIRGFADRGSWKFTRESVEELGRLMQADSSPDIPIITDVPIAPDAAGDEPPVEAAEEEFEIDFDDAFFEDDDEESEPVETIVAEAAEEVAVDAEDIAEGALAADAESSDVHMDFDESFFDDEEEEIEIAADATLAADSPPDSEVELVAEDPGETVVEADDGALDLAASDSDVRLAFDDSVFDSDPDLIAVGSDVQLAGDSGVNLDTPDTPEDTSSSSVLDFAEGENEDRDSDSDVQLVGQASDSDVSIVAEEDSDSDIVLVDDPTDGEFDVADEASNDSSMIFQGSENEADIDLASTMFADADDSDVNMVGEDADSDSDESSIMMAGIDSVSDINLAEAAAADSSNLLPGTDPDLQLGDTGDGPSSESSAESEIPLSDSDSDIRLADDDVNESDESSQLLVGTDTASDIRMVADEDSDTDGNESDESSQLLMGTDADIDIQLAADQQAENSSDESAFLLMGSDSDSDVRLAAEPSDGSAEIVTGIPAGVDDGDSNSSSNDSSRMLTGFDSDSDVVLSNDANDSSGTLVGLDSDSDVRLDAGDSEVTLDATEDALPLFDSDSDVRLAVDGSDLLQGLDPIADDSVSTTNNADAADSDSDVNLIDMPMDMSDSSVVLSTPDDSGDLLPGLSDDQNSSFDSGATVAMQLPEDSDLKLIDSAVSISDESGISLEMDDGMLVLDADESGISLEADDSGISLEADDSGISLESLDSGAMIAPNSGITLLDDDDSGITLDAGDSGIALFDDDDSGISLEGDDMGQTQPMSAVGGGLANLGASGANTMQMDMPTGGDTNDSEFELAGLDDDDDDFGTDTSVLMFDDDDTGDEFSVASEPTGSADDDLVLEDLDGGDAFEDDLGDDDFEDDFEDEEMDDVWDAEDEDDGDGDFEAGESQVGGFVAPAEGAAAAGVGWAADDSPWGAGWTSAVSIGAIFSVLSAFVGVELIRTMWMWTQPGNPESWLLGMLGGMFGG